MGTSMLYGMIISLISQFVVQWKLS